MRFTGKLIKVGNGAAISASKKILRENGWKFGQELEVVVMKKDKKAALKRLRGLFPQTHHLSGKKIGNSNDFS